MTSCNNLSTTDNKQNMATTNSSVNLDVAERLDITCRKGDTLALSVDFTDANGVALDMSEYSFEMEVRDTSDSVIISKASVSYTANADSTTGRLTIVIDSSAITSAGTYLYDLETTKTSNLYVQTWLYGIFKINEDITA